MMREARPPPGIRKLNDSIWEFYRPVTGEIEFEIIFLHGLQLGAFEDAFWETWLVRDSDTQEVWPKIWLSQEFPQARILSVSYHSRATKSDGQLTMSHLGENLVSDIIMDTKYDIGQNCPVFLVGHSWGGIVIKQLVLSALFRKSIIEDNRLNKGEVARIDKFYNNLSGVFYYATPHGGSRLADWANRVPGTGRIVKLLRTLNADTAMINSRFRELRKIPAFAGAENLETPYQASRWFNFNDRATVVEEVSSRQDIDQFYTFTRTDHFTVCKARSPGDSVIMKLVDFITRSLEEKKARSSGKSRGMDVTTSIWRVADLEPMMERAFTSRDRASIGNTVTTNEEYLPPGVTQLNDSLYQFCAPRFGAAVIKIIFFHGLPAGEYRTAYRDAYWKSWMSKDGSTLWPQTLLGKEFPTAQIFSVSYSAAASKQRTSIYGDLSAEKLVEDIILGELFSDDCPILLVGHSLGGLVLKQLVTSAHLILENCEPWFGKKIERIGRFLHNVRGIFYYSTPQYGTTLADIASEIPGRDEVLAFLKSLSEESVQLNYLFEDWEMRERVKVTCLREGLPTDPKIWGVKTMQPIVIVGADLCRYDTDKFYTVPDANHITICQPNDTTEISFRVLEHFVKECLELDENDVLLSTTPLLDAVTKALDAVTKAYSPGTSRRVPDKIEEALTIKERTKVVEHQEASEIEPGSQIKRASGHVFCVEDLRMEIEKGGKDGYFVSSKWLFNLEEYERENFMSILRRAGYYETRETCTTISFARIGNNRQNDIPSGDSRSSTKVDDTGAQTGGSDVQVGIGREGFNVVKIADIPDVCGSENLTSSSIHCGSRTFEDEKLEEMSLAVGEQQAMQSKSFEAALKRRGHRAFCVSTEWLSNLKDHERKTLEAGYEKIRQTKTVTWYEKNAGHIKKPPVEDAEDTRDNDPSKSSKRNDGIRGAWTSARRRLSATLFGGRQNLNDEEKSSSSSSVETTMETRLIQDEFSTCHRRLFSVSCSSPSQTMNLPAIVGHSRVQRFGETVVTMPGRDQSQNCSTRMEKPFVLMAPYFAGGSFREVSVNLKAMASLTLSGCVTFDPGHTKVRLKFSLLSGQVENVQESEEELLHEIVLGSLYTTVYGCMKSPTNGNILLDDIILNLEDEYHPPRRRVLATARQSEDDSTDSADLSWLEISPSPGNCEPGSTTLVLRGDIKGRRDDDSKRQVQPADSLHFQRPPPVKLEGDVLYPDSFLEFRIRHQLKVSYINLCREEGERCREVCPYKEITQTIDFGCCLTMSTNCLLEPT